jgi:mannose-6-phosphate isomerase-like protein (cupin superfamily)
MTKLVKKHWGHEFWIEDGTLTPYAFKQILFKAGNKTSLQVHKFKTETNYVLSGTGFIYVSPTKLDIDKFLESNIIDDNILNYKNTFLKIELKPGSTCTVHPGFIHRVEAITDLEIVEVSTTELDDVIRLLDDKNRPHGKIQAEHE